MHWSSTSKKEQEAREGREEATDQCFGWQLFKNGEETRVGKEEATNQCIGWLLFFKEEETREMEERRPPLNALAGNFLKMKKTPERRKRGGCQLMHWLASFFKR